MIRRLALAVGAAVLLAVPATAAAAAPGKEAKPVKPEVPEATVKIDVGHLHGGKATILDTVPVRGTVSPYVESQHVEVTFYLNGKQLLSRQVKVQPGPNQTGTFRSSVVVKESGKYAVAAKHVATPSLGADSTVRKSWTVSFPKLNRGECSDVVGAFKGHLAKMGYVSGGGKCFTARLGREVLAYRKVNDMDRTKKAGPGILKSVFADQGGYHVKYPDAGEHAEVPLDKQVLVLIKDGKPFAIYPVSTGKPSTPTITGHYEFYRQEPGYNSEGMYYSFYWHNGYAVHGYHEVPTYAASHGCVRTFIADQPRIYEQLHYGESIFVW
ncbi:MAG TPA: L,D-transpeptidase [Solirubrobacterales bacterium]|nr:L,D-transpeptidase [Solirubrobacterales bacterium]